MPAFGGPQLARLLWVLSSAELAVPQQYRDQVGAAS
jgi:hypothetical protein